MTRTLETLCAARALLAGVTPLKTDCGRACGGACCLPDEDGQGGMLLFPGEEQLYSPLPKGFSLSRDTSLSPNGLLLTCEGTCERGQRPLSCRLFPLLPKMRDGAVKVVRDGRAYVVCPLLDGGLSAFDPAFKEAVRQAGALLYACPEHKAFLDALHRWIASLKSETLGI